MYMIFMYPSMYININFLKLLLFRICKKDCLSLWLPFLDN